MSNDTRAAKLSEIYDDEGNLTKIVAENASTGEHILDILWDPRDNQDPETLEDFRGWAGRIMRSKGFESIN